MKDFVNIVTVGHVDHGKSTVIGRLLADTGSLPEGKLEAVRATCLRNAKPFEYAFLLDALKEEQAQGITIDTARCFFHSEKRRYILIDAPGHIEFLKNMVTGAARSDAALMVIDAKRGVEENTRRHGYFLALLGIRQIAVLVNKMDLAGYKQKRFEEVKSDFQKFLQEINIEVKSYIPVSALAGENIAHHSVKMPWYHGFTVLEQLDDFSPSKLPKDLSLRMPVQGVYKFTENGDNRRIIAGIVETGFVKAGDKLVFYPSGKKSTVKSLEIFDAKAPEIYEASMSAGFTLTDEIYLSRGEIACREIEKAPKVGVRFRANIFWLGQKAFMEGNCYDLKCGTAKVKMHLEKILSVMDASKLEKVSRNYVGKNEVAECTICLDYPMAFDLAVDNPITSRCVIVDNYEISGGGIIVERLDEYNYDVRNLRWSRESVTKNDMARLLGQKGMVIWMTGLSGSGKTTIAEEARKQLTRDGIASYIIDGDTLRKGLNADLKFSEADRNENIRRAAHVAKMMSEAGLITFVTLISPFEKARKLARDIIEADFYEVYVKADVDQCEKRDPKKLYEKARRGAIKNFTGIDSPYEVPVNPELVLSTETHSESECVNTLLMLIKEQSS